jgi:hypothetical protein
MKRVALFTFSFVLVAFVAGCGSSNMTNHANNGTSSVLLSMGDATNDRIVAFALTVNSIALTGGSNPTVLTTPTRIEFVHNAGTFQPLVQTDVPSGTFTGATLTLSNPTVVAIDTTTHQPVQLTATLSTSTVNVSFGTPLMVSSSIADVRFDLDLANTVSISGNTATITPTFNVTTKVVASDNNNNEDDEKDVRGTVNSVTAPKFTITSHETAQMLTFTTDGNTKFDGITGLSQLTPGMTVRVDFVVQSDGTMLAKKVETEEGDNDGFDVEAFVTTVTGTPATQITVTNDSISSSFANILNMLGIGDKLTITINSNTAFSVADEGTGQGQVDVTGLSVTFGASNIGADQNVDIGINHQGDFDDLHMSAAANSIRLEQQTLTGHVSNFSGTTPGTFTLTVDADSAFAILTGQTTLTVNVRNNTVTNMTIANGARVRVRGLLFVNGTAHTLVASRVTTEQ